MGSVDLFSLVMVMIWNSSTSLVFTVWFFHVSAESMVSDDAGDVYDVGERWKHKARVLLRIHCKNITQYGVMDQKYGDHGLSSLC